MTAPAVTAAQLGPIVERALTKHHDGHAACVVVTADPATAPELDTVAGRPARVLASRSPLEIRAALRDHAARGDALLVVVTDLDASDLGDDLLARVVNRRPFTVDRWRTVCQLFGAEAPSVELARKPHIAEALIEAHPLEGYPKVVSKVLDVETAIDALLRTRLDLAPDDPSARLLELAATPEAAGLLVGGPPALAGEARTRLAGRYGPLGAAVSALISAGKGADVISWGLAGAAIHHPSTSAEAARALLERELNRPGLNADAWRLLGQAAEDHYRASYDSDAQARWRYAAATILDDLDAAHCAQWSDVIPAGFDQRLDRTADLLHRWHQHPDDAALAGEAHAAIQSLKQHLDRTTRSDQIRTAEMVARILRRRSHTLPASPSFSELAAAYRDDGSWFDAARVVVSRGSTQPALDTLCKTITADADRTRSEQSRALATTLAKAALPLPEELIGVEDLLRDVVAPLAEARPVLLVVLDGMGLPTFHDFAAELTAASWTAVATGPRTRSPAVAVLPTVTEVSRTSLLAGTIRTGDGESEKRAFPQHPALVQATGLARPPVLFHKRDLRVGGLDALPDEALNAIEDPTQRIVAVVVNNIDERLKDVVVPIAGWRLDDLDPLRHLLAEARRAGRAVVLTADHGHILDRDAEQRPAGGGGERWRPAGGGAPAPDEVQVSGPRVGAGEGTVVLPIVEQVRYATRRNGYHGGLTPQELFVPLVVLVAEELDGWEPVSLGPPAWWHHHAVVTPSAARPGAAPRRAIPGPAAPTLFDPAPSTEAAHTEGLAGPEVPVLIESLVASDRFAEQMANPRVRLTQLQITPVLARLADGTPLAHEELTALTGLALGRVGRFVAQLQELLNVEGYPVVRADAGEVRLDVALLQRQFDL